MNEATITIPSSGDFSSIHEVFVLAQQKVEMEVIERLVVHATKDSFIKADGLAYLTAKCLDLSASGTQIELSGDKQISAYLERMDFHSHLDLEQEGGNRLPAQGRFLPLSLVGVQEDSYNVTDKICDLVLRHFEDGRKFLPAMEWMVNELTDNIIIHAEAPVPGVVCAQFYPSQKRIEIGICDMGLGLRGSLGTSREIETYQEALKLALKRGVTRDPEVGMGYGMAGSLEISKVNEGDFSLWSGGATFEVKNGQEVGYNEIKSVKGTGLALSVRTDRPVQLADTWIGGGDWGFIENQADRLEEGGGMDITQECANTGSRPPGKYLRRKIVALLPEMESPLVLDFSNVRAASSSFLDELLGRLAFEFGTDVFPKKIQLVGMNETIKRLANVVIAQRTGEIDLEKEEETSNSKVVEEMEDSKAVNGWLVRTSITTAENLFTFKIPLSGSLFSGIREGDGVALEGAEGDVLAFGRLLRKRSQLDSTTFYLDGVAPTTRIEIASALGMDTGRGSETVLRQSWPLFNGAMVKGTGVQFVDLPVLTGNSRAEQAYLRELFKLAVGDELQGPAQGPEEEIIGMSVRERYLVGKLAPKDADLGVEADEELGGECGAQPDHSGAPEVEVSKNQTLVPSSVGLTFCIDETVKVVEVEASWGSYERGESSTKFDDKTGNPKRAWRRIPCGGKIRISISEGSIAPEPPDPNQPEVLLQGTVRKAMSSGDRLVTVFLVNDQPKPSQSEDAAWLFQPEVVVRDIEKAPIFRRRPVLMSDGEDLEREALEMIYRNEVEFAVGHGIAIHAETLEGNPELGTEIRTVVMPENQVPVTETPGLEPEDRPAMQGLVSEGLLDMKKLAEMKRSDLASALRILTVDYGNWIGEQRSRISSDLVGYEASADEAMGRCDKILERLEEGIKCLETDDHALEAFRFANRAMALQRVHSIFSLEKRRGNESVVLSDFDIPKNRSWRPFQLAFVLLSLPGLADPKHRDRTKPLDAQADLLWFPTGGGKTEAYLGVAAFTMAIRRLHGVMDGYNASRGLAVLMRYTLRLLTIQQFQRATALLCAMETIRKADTERWGQERFTLGLWVGNRVTPGTTEESHRAIEDERNDKRGGGATPAQLTFCPWCGTGILPGRDINVDKEAGRTAIFCGDKMSQCEFTKAQSKGLGLPVVVVDDEIYRRPPTMLIGTVDKFAMMAWRGQARTLFGKAEKECERHGLLWPDAKCSGRHPRRGDLPGTQVKDIDPIRPPDLIIQDEFHLISGPLGTMVGLYETAIDELCSWKSGESKVRPKIIASTATVRKAREQINNVFMRDVSVFPPHGLDINDNFFSVQRSVDEKPGRLYVGVCSPGSSRPAILIRLYVAQLTAAQALFEKFGSAADPYMTVVGYFNSLRELGGMKRLAEDDVQTRSYRVQMSDVERPGLAQRSVSIIDELTSRVSSKQIPAKLDQLEVKHRENWKKGETRAIDVVLATNMLSVGVDVNRLGLMSVNGQPKTTAEYIQATSRVGRSFPGIVFTVLTWSRPRDLSHYETFEHYHQTFYKHVEAQSVTPFSPRAMDRGLTGAMISLFRHQFELLNPNLGAETMDSPNLTEVGVVKTQLGERAWKVSNDSSQNKVAQDMVVSRVDRWVAEVTQGGRSLGYEAVIKGDDIVALLKKPGVKPWDELTAPMSLREVEPNVNLVMDDANLSRGPEWQAQTPQNGGSEL